MIVILVLGILLSFELVTSTPRFLSNGEELGSPIKDIQKAFYKKMAEFAVNENNKANPKSEPLQLVSVDKGYFSTEGDYEIFLLYLTASNSHGESKYLTQVDIVYVEDKFLFVYFKSV
ncbi:hypothetical protein LINPERPRIM_LOCUS17958 [Linum perenne]